MSVIEDDLDLAAMVIDNGSGRTFITFLGIETIFYSNSNC